MDTWTREAFFGPTPAGEAPALTKEMLDKAAQELYERRQPPPLPTRIPSRVNADVMRRVGQKDDQQVALIVWEAWWMASYHHPVSPAHVAALRVASARANGGTVDEGLWNESLVKWVLGLLPATSVDEEVPG